MYCVKNIAEDLYWVGGSDRRLSLFENVYPVPNGVMYNSYLIIDDKIALIDAVDKSISGIFFENLEYLLHGREIDFMIINHMEPDHSATLKELVTKFPEMRIVCNAKTVAMIDQFFEGDFNSNIILIGDNDNISLGKHYLTFYLAPMVHWPETMVCFDETTGTLFSADAFGSFGAFNGNIFADEIDYKNEWTSEARRYYTNIVGKYGKMVLNLLEKASKLKIERICPLHGLVWRSDLKFAIERYKKWASYEPEKKGVVLAYSSIYGNTENAINILASKLSDSGIKDIVVYDTSTTHFSYILSDCFKFSHLVFASPTYNGSIFTSMNQLLTELKEHNLQNRTVALIENGSWGITSGKIMTEILLSMKNISLIGDTLTIKSALKQSQENQIDELTSEIVKSIGVQKKIEQGEIQNEAFFKIPYGLFVLISKDGDFDNGCIVNTVMQITNEEQKIIVGLNKTNYSHDIILKTGKFNISALTEKTPFDVIKRFGFASGKDMNKFDNFDKISSSENHLNYLTDFSNMFISAEVVEVVDCATHSAFVAKVTEAQVISDEKSITYDYYLNNVKPNKSKSNEDKKGFICKICGYVYEGETLPSDFICPLCKHPAEDFEPLK